MTSVCAWCKKVRVGGTWIVTPPEGVVTHGICPECAAQFKSRSEGAE